MQAWFYSEPFNRTLKEMAHMDLDQGLPTFLCTCTLQHFDRWSMYH